MYMVETEFRYPEFSDVMKLNNHHDTPRLGYKADTTKTITKTLPAQTVRTTRTITKTATATTTRTKCTASKCTATSTRTSCTASKCTATKCTASKCTATKCTATTARTVVQTKTATVTTEKTIVQTKTATSIITSVSTQNFNFTETKSITQTVTSTVVPSECPPPELLTNGDFEASNTSLSPWTIDYISDSERTPWSLEQGGPDSSKVVYVVRPPSQSWYPPSLVQEVILCERHTYTISLSVAITDGCWVDPMLDRMWFLWTMDGIGSTGGQWKRVSRTFTLDGGSPWVSGTHKLILAISKSWDKACSVMIDNISITS
ncbi:hypothetical protein EDB81DRAFT_765073 [Dactylonectria macrodidyma]|uniref:Uncharacterized protein n=1 Tax=Dactylonectria macrodidyma TaxID=307937 RepID=A0A9P9DVU9_9HYPO|nr:hypothetical protein EDB81DRAFT_765073 [Dactylonectria macrodidyma]